MREERRGRDDREVALKDAERDIEKEEREGNEEEVYVLTCVHVGCNFNVHAPKNFRCPKHSEAYYRPYWNGYRGYADSKKTLEEI